MAERTLLQSKKYSGDKPSVMLMLDNRCDHAKCSCCYLKHVRGLTPLSIEAALERSLALKNQGYNVIPRHGEPLLNPDSLRIFQALDRKYIATAGATIARHPELAKMVASSGITQVGLTLDNLGGTKNEMDTVPTETVIKAAQICQQVGLDTYATVVLTPNTLGFIDDFCQLAQEVGLVGLRFSRVVPIDDSMQQHVISDLEAQQVIAHINELRIRVPKSSLFIGASATLGLTGRHKAVEKQQAPGYKFCMAGQQIVAVGLDDIVYPCEVLAQQPYAIGKFEEGQINLDPNSPFFQLNKNLGAEQCMAYELFTNRR